MSGILCASVAYAWRAKGSEGGRWKRKEYQLDLSQYKELQPVGKEARRVCDGVLRGDVKRIRVPPIA